MKLNFRLPLQDTPESDKGGAADTKAADTKAADTKDVKDAKDTKDTKSGTIVSDDTGNKKPDAADTKDGKKAEDKSKEAADAKPGGKDGDADAKPKAPEKYALKIPDGGRLDESDLQYVEQLARGADLSNEDAQAFLDSQATALEEQSGRYLAEVKADKELGGDNFGQTEKLVTAGVNFLFPKGDKDREGFLKFMARGGAGNNIHVVRAFARLGKRTGEDSGTGSGQGAGGPKTLEQHLYTKPIKGVTDV